MSLIEHLGGPGWKDFLGRIFATTLDELEGDARLAGERGATPEQVYAALREEGVSRAEYRAYMEAELLQLRVLQRRVRGRINVTEADLQQAYHRAVREAADGTVARGMLRQRSLYLRELRRTVGVDDRLDMAPATR